MILPVFDHRCLTSFLLSAQSGRVPFFRAFTFFRSARPGEAFVHQEPGIPESIAFFPALVTQDLIPCLCSLHPVQCSRTYHFCSFCNRLPLLQCYPGYGLWFKSIRAFCCGFVRPAGHDEGEKANKWRLLSPRQLAKVKEGFMSTPSMSRQGAECLYYLHVSLCLYDLHCRNT